MKATEIQIGDRLVVNGQEHYRVEGVDIDRHLVRARVRFTVDGGTDVRTWYWNDEVPLTREPGAS